MVVVQIGIRIATEVGNTIATEEGTWIVTKVETTHLIFHLRSPSPESSVDHSRGVRGRGHSRNWGRGRSRDHGRDHSMDPWVGEGEGALQGVVVIDVVVLGHLIETDPHLLLQSPFLMYCILCQTHHLSQDHPKDEPLAYEMPTKQMHTATSHFF